MCFTFDPVVVMRGISQVEFVEREDVIVIQDELFVGRNPCLFDVLGMELLK